MLPISTYKCCLLSRIVWKFRAPRTADRLPKAFTKPTADVLFVACHTGRVQFSAKSQVEKIPENSRDDTKKVCLFRHPHVGVSKNRGTVPHGTPKSSILIRLSIIFTIHFRGFPTPIFGLPPMCFGGCCLWEDNQC